MVCGDPQLRDRECQAAFCALCLTDCGDNAHNHVSTQCRWRRELHPEVMYDAYFIQPGRGEAEMYERWVRFMDERRCEKLRAHLQRLEVATRALLFEDRFVKAKCEEFGLLDLLGQAVAPAPNNPRVAALMALFPDRAQAELERVLEWAGNDVDGAANRMLR